MLRRTRRLGDRSLISDADGRSAPTTISVPTTFPPSLISGSCRHSRINQRSNCDWSLLTRRDLGDSPYVWFTAGRRGNRSSAVRGTVSAASCAPPFPTCKAAAGALQPPAVEFCRCVTDSARIESNALKTTVG